jgi:hypothetical protein
VYSIIPNILVGIALVLYLAIAVVIVRKYLRTRDVGFVLLGAAVVIWPLASGLLQHGERVLMDRLVHGHPVGVYPFSLVERREMSAGVLITSLNLTEQIIGGCLLLIAVLYLSRPKATPASDDRN